MGKGLFQTLEGGAEMKLSEALLGKSKVMIGTEKGSGFIYKGLASECRLEDREVVESYPSIRYKGVDIIIIKGRESKVDEVEPMDFHGCFNDAVVQGLIAGIYKQMTDDLQDAYTVEGCLIPWYDTMKGLQELENAIKYAPGHSLALGRLMQIKIDLYEILDWIKFADSKGGERWLMREKSPDTYGHIEAPEAVIRAVKKVEVEKRRSRYSADKIIG